MSVVPDSIEPIEGWKTWNIVNGMLCSPQSHMLWGPKKPAQAKCPGIPPSTWAWVPRKGRKDPEPVTPVAHTPATAMAALTYVMVSPSLPMEPQVVLPHGYYWSWEEVPLEHGSTPAEGCSCGIYIAEHIAPATGYGSVLGKVKGWGTTIEHAQGWRCEYAYPSELYAADEKEAETLAVYGVPVLLAKDMPDGEAKDFTEMRFLAERPKTPLARFLDAAWSGPWMPILMSAVVVLYTVMLAIDPNPFGVASLSFTAAVGGVIWGIRLADQ